MKNQKNLLGEMLKIMKIAFSEMENMKIVLSEMNKYKNLTWENDKI